MRPQSPTLFLSPPQFTFYTRGKGRCFPTSAWINHQTTRCLIDGHGQSRMLVQTESKADSSFASIVVLNVSNINFGASAFTVMVAPRLK